MHKGGRGKRGRFPLMAKLALLGAFALLLWVSARAVEEGPGFQALPALPAAKLQWLVRVLDYLPLANMVAYRAT